VFKNGKEKIVQSVRVVTVRGYNRLND